MCRLLRTAAILPRAAVLVRRGLTGGGLRSSFGWDLDFTRDLIADTTGTPRVDLDEEVVEEALEEREMWEQVDMEIVRGNNKPSSYFSLKL